MKKVITTLFLIMAIFAYSQQQQLFSNRFPDLTTSDFKPLNLELANFSRNYEKVFGEYQFMFDSNNFGDKNVYVGYDNKLYYQGRSTFIMENPGPHNMNYSWDADYIKGLVSGLKMLFNNEKDYTKSYINYNK